VLPLFLVSLTKSLAGIDENKSGIDLGFGVIKPESWEDATYPGSMFTKEHRTRLIRYWSKGLLAIENDRLRKARCQERDAEMRRRYEAASEREGFVRWSDVKVKEGLESAVAAPAESTGRLHLFNKPPAPAAPAQPLKLFEKSQLSNCGTEFFGSLGRFSKLLTEQPLSRAQDWKKKHQQQVKLEKKKLYRDNTKGCATLPLNSSFLC